MKQLEQVPDKDGLLSSNGEFLRRGLIRTIRGNITELTYHTYFSRISFEENSAPFPSARFSAKVSFLSDSFTILENTNINADILPLSIHLAPRKETEWRAHIGFLEQNREIGNPSEWYLEIYLPSDAFNDLLHAFKNGYLNGGRIGIDGSLWSERLNYHAPPSSHVTWYLLPDKGSAGATSQVTEFGWHYKTQAFVQAPEDDEIVSQNDLVVVPALRKPGKAPAPIYRAALESIGLGLKLIFLAIVGLSLILLLR